MISMQTIYGIHPVLESLKSGGKGIERLILAHGKKGEAVKEILNLAAQKHIAIEYKDRSYIDKIVPTKRHQGIVCFCKEFKYRSFYKIIEDVTSSEKGGFILILDSVMDPQNLGSLIRSGHCFGANAVVIPKNRAASVTPAVVKASAGCAEYISVSQVTNIATTLDLLKREGFWIYGTDVKEGKNIAQFDFSGRIGVVLGGEGSGLRPLVRQKCDFMISIPMEGKIDSLNVSVAGGILLYEIMKSRTSACDMVRPQSPGRKNEIY
ncbi:MAG: 23S rRNA (guanosine(2251)-2'-O)-methyltransferase RlmB [Syntrophales bacterium]|jgi:23S rRNA (guanosine2251-2'-O)-methyltransferase|nr:23S rRNA (guanosine(2251)-2'-O)-methyltransferase RlmB [Syntrophales bacterium]MDY0043864.1 23S rRNA (guanosine(2251)-2'-O)-methyltransferase RlmB [Syntrophales bacterium]